MVEERRSNGNGRRSYDIEDKVALAEIRRDVKHIVAAVPTFVTKAEFQPVQRIVYGLVSVTLLSVIVALVALVVT